jgi:hypothetical protein
MRDRHSFAELLENLLGCLSQSLAAPSCSHQKREHIGWLDGHFCSALIHIEVDDLWDLTQDRYLIKVAITDLALHTNMGSEPNVLSFIRLSAPSDQFLTSAVRFEMGDQGDRLFGGVIERSRGAQILTPPCEVGTGCATAHIFLIHRLFSFTPELQHGTTQFLQSPIGRPGKRNM